MNIFSSPQSPSLSLVAATTAFAAVVSTPAVAQNMNAPLVAELSTPAKTAKIIGKDVVWRCEGAVCSAGESGRRPAINCAGLVKQTGPVTRFVVDGVALDDAALQRCNSFAR